MYPVHGLPEVGSSVSVHITTVNLNPHTVLVEFGGDLNHGQEAREEYEQLKKDLDVPRKRQNNFEGKPGDICLVYEDRSWHRVRILSKSEHEYKVFLIDDGKILCVSSKVLTKCPRNLCSLPPKVEHCILANVSPLCLESAWSLAASKFIRSLCGKNISGCVQDVIMPSRIMLLDIPSISTQIYELGFARKMSDEAFKSLVMRSLQLPRINPSVQTDLVTTNGQQEHAGGPDKLHQYLYPELLPGTVEIVTVTQVVHPLKIYCKLRVFSQELVKLSDQLQDCYEDRFSAQMPMLLSDGSPCATKGSDGKWYRSVLQQNNVSEVVKVFHVDYGIGDFVELRNIRPLSARFFRLPVVTYACSLHGIIDKGLGWRTDQIDYLKSVVLDQILVGKFEHHSVNEGVYYVSLYGNDNVNLNETFGRREQCLLGTEKICGDPTLETLNKVAYKNVHSLEDGNVVRSSKTEEKGRHANNIPAASTLQKDMYVESPPKVEMGAKVKVQITCVHSVSQFYGHFTQNTDTVRKITKDIQQLCRKNPQTKFSVSPKMMCFAKYTDGQWHRGRIESTHPNILVQFVDYGDLVVLDKSDILPLPPKAVAIASVPIQAVQFELFNITLPESCKLNEWFKNYATDGIFMVTVRQNSSGKLSVEMYEDRTNLNLKIKEMWNKTKKKESNVGKGTSKTKSFKESSGATAQSRENNSKQVQKPGVQGALEQKSISGRSNGHNRARPNHVVSYPKLADLPSKTLNAGYISDVYVSHCNSPSSFFVQLTSDEDEIFSLLDQLNSSQFSDAHVELNLLQPGDLVRAEYPADGAWYRAVVQNKRDGMIQVQFIDFGNEATLLPIKIKQLGKQFLSTPRLSIHCMLEDGGRRGKRDWTEEEIKAFKNAAGENGEKTIKCKFIQKETHFWLVDLEHQEGPLFNVAFKSGAQTESRMYCHEDTQLLTFKEPPVTRGQTVEAYASSIVGPNYFWCQFKNTEELDKISLLAQEIGNCIQTKAVHPVQLHQGGMCLACFSDQLWYRAQVINAKDDKVSVLFIDYGNESETDLNFIKSLPAKLLETPPQAFLCQLEALGSTEGTWSEAADERFFELLVDEPLKVTIQNMVMRSELPKCPQYCVLVESKGRIVNNLMIEYWCDPNGNPVVQEPSTQHFPQAVDLPPRVIKPGTSEVYVSHINSLTSFFVQLVEDEDTLFSLTELLNSPQPLEKEEMHALSVQQGNLVKALFPEDESWYRAVVKDTTENGMILVEFIDFGNEATVSPFNVRRLDERLLSYPRFSIHCSCSRDDRFKTEKGLKEQVFLFKTIFGEAGENTLACSFIKQGVIAWEVKLTPSSSASESVSENCDNLEVKALPVVSESVKQPQLLFKKPDVSLGQTVEACASCIVGPNYFWCQFSNSEILDQITLLAQEHGNSGETQPVLLDDLDPGCPCLARFCDDQMWYRAQTINKSSNTVSVLFIDFGNESDICEGSVKALPCELLESPPQAFLCRLEGFDSLEGSWDGLAIDDFYEHLVDKPLKVTVQCVEETVDSSRPLYCVKVESPECLVNETMVKLWKNSAQHNQNPAEVIESCEDSSLQPSEDQPVSKDETNESLAISKEDAHLSELHCPEQQKASETSVVNGDLLDLPENKVEGADVVTNSDVVANDPTSNSDVVIYDVDHQSDSIPVVPSELQQEKNEDVEEAGTVIPMESSRSTAWVAGLENQMLPMVCTEDSCDSKCVFK